MFLGQLHQLLCFNGIQLLSATTVKFLGLLFYHRLSYIPHLTGLKTDSNETLVMLRVLSGSP